MLMLAAAVAGCTGEGNPAGYEPTVSISEQVTVEVGQTIDFSMYTHCGVERAGFNGQTWEAVEPLYSSPDKIGPPDGWDNPFQKGTLTLESPQRAVFAAPGKRVALKPSTTTGTQRLCS